MGIVETIPLITILLAIAGLGISLYFVSRGQTMELKADIREIRSDMKRVQERAADTDLNFGNRLASIEGLLGAFANPPDQQAVYQWRRLGQTESRGEG